MRYEELYIDDITDSKEVLYSRPKHVTIIFIYISGLALILLFIASLICEKDTYIKVKGNVISNMENITISANVQGKIDNLKVKNGYEIKKGDILYSIGDYVVKSPCDGTVKYLIDVTKSQSIKVNTPILTIIPKKNSILKIELDIEDKDITKIKKGQKVKCSFVSLPYKKYGNIESVVEEIHDVSDAKNIGLYKAEVPLNIQYLHNNKKETALIKPGMNCDCNIIISKQKIIYYILDMIYLRN